MARGFGPGGPGGRPMHDPNDRTPRDTKYILKKLWHYIKQYWIRLALAVGLTFGSNALALWGPSLSGYAIDAIIGPGEVDFERVFYYAGLMIVFYITSAALGYLINVVMVTTTQKIVYRMRQDAFESVSRLPISYTDSHAIGDILSKLTYDIDTINIAIPGAQDMTVVLISDVHLGAVGSEKRLPEMVEKINALEPDLVCIAGDFFDSDFSAISDPEAAAATLRSLSAPYGTWACLGNHDAGSTAAQMQAFLERCGIRVLHDEYTTLPGKLVLAGRLDASPIGGYGGTSRQPLDLAGADPALPVVVMDHNPAHIGEYGPEVDLILCGHTHKGQIFPGSIITNRMYTVDYGYYRANDTAPQVIVSSGVGTWGMPMRVGSDCEIVKIRIHP